MNDPRVTVIHATDHVIERLSRASAETAKLIIGNNPSDEKPSFFKSSTDNEADVIEVPRLRSLDVDFPWLQQFYLWSTRSLSSLPGLPNSLRVLEVRKSQHLTMIESLPASLERLILEDNPNLSGLPSFTGQVFPELVELSLKNCPVIDPLWIRELIDRAPALCRIDLSGCPQVRALPVKLPEGLERIDLNGCVQLQRLPRELPPSLRRIGLSDAKNLREVPELPADIDYLDLAGTVSLQQLPQLPDPKDVSDEAFRGDLRTLFLCGSGVLAPPASEHGNSPDTNVARETKEFFHDVSLVGRGSVRRCKLLLLGNGAAGKTSLALNLHPILQNRPVDKGGHHPGSTHGVQFWDWPDFEAAEAPGEQADPVHLHMWDFGGQEIYHNTHRLFVSRGSVFLVLWNPDQDGKQPEKDGSYQDVWYPLRYWLDYIHQECPHNQPPIAIVCTHQGREWHPADDQQNQKLKDDLQERLREQIGDDYANRIPMFVLDSESADGIGQRQDVQEWLSSAVYNVVKAQGTEVPIYWEIAQDLVEQWLPRPATDIGPGGDQAGQPAAHRRLSLDKFTSQLHNAITQRLNGAKRPRRLDALFENYQDGQFLTSHRVKRTLRFLTHSGWLYWNEALHDLGVVIDQRWALDTAYCLLERRDSKYRTKLLESEGRFTLDDLCEHSNAFRNMDAAEQRLLLSFMVSVGVCFRLSGHGSNVESWTCLSPEHLPETADFVEQFDAVHADTEVAAVSSTQLHRGHWIAIVRTICERFGEAGQYSRNACMVEHSEWPRRWGRHRSTLLQYCPDDRTLKLGGQIQIRTSGEERQARLDEVRSLVQSFLPGQDGNPSDAVTALEGTGAQRANSAGKPKIFFSYAWDPVEKKGELEGPVDAIYDSLAECYGNSVVLLRDKNSIEPGDYISEYVHSAGRKDTDLMIVFTSDRYWRSWWCMLELAALARSLSHKERGVENNVLVVADPSGIKRTAEDIAELKNHWYQIETIHDGDEELPATLPEQLLDLNWRRRVRDFVNVIESRSIPLTSDARDVCRIWESDQSEDIIAWVKQKTESLLEQDAARD